MIDARRMEVYNLFVNSEFKQLKDISADVIESDSYKEFEPFVFFGDGAEKLVEGWSNRSCQIDASIDSSAIGQVDIALEKFNDKDFEDVAYFEPFYLKDFIAGKKPATSKS